MKRNIAITAFALIIGLANSAMAKDWTTVRIATEGAYPPWNATDPSGKLIGFEVDLAEDLCQRMAVTCEIVAQDWEGIIPSLTAGKYDVIIAGMSITDERKEVISFSDSYAGTPAYFAVLKDSDLAGYQSAMDKANLEEVSPDEQAEIDALKEALDGKAVGVQVATTHANFVGEYLGDAVDMRSYDTQENLDLDLQAGRIDAALAYVSQVHRTAPFGAVLCSGYLADEDELLGTVASRVAIELRLVQRAPPPIAAMEPRTESRTGPANRRRRW